MSVGGAVGGAAGGTAAGAAAGAGIGAIVGSVVPIVGTIVGAVVGGLIGGAVGGTAGTTIGAAAGGIVGAKHDSSIRDSGQQTLGQSPASLHLRLPPSLNGQWLSKALQRQNAASVFGFPFWAASIWSGAMTYTLQMEYTGIRNTSTQVGVPAVPPIAPPITPPTTAPTVVPTTGTTLPTMAPTTAPVATPASVPPAAPPTAPPTDILFWFELREENKSKDEVYKTFTFSSSSRELYQRDPEENRAAKRKKYEHNSASIMASKRRWYWKDPDAVLIANRMRYQTRPDVKRAAKGTRYRRGLRTTTTKRNSELFREVIDTFARPIHHTRSAHATVRLVQMLKH
eukprot:Em0001g3739a